MICIMEQSGSSKEVSGSLSYSVSFIVCVCLHVWMSGGGAQLGPLSTVATNGLLCQARVIMMMEKLVECLAGKTKVQ
jgi:hypothetical protein